MASKKWAITHPGANLCSTVKPPTTTSASRPATRPTDSHVRSRRRGVLRSAASNAPSEARVTAALIKRFPNSIQAWYCRGATTLVRVHAGQSGQPSPEPVRRTAAPENMVSASAHTAMAATTRKAAGVTRQERQVRQARPGNRFSGARLGEAGSIGPYRRTAGAAVPPDVGGAALCWDCRCCRSVMGRCLSRPPRQPRPVRGRSQWGGVWLVSSR